MTGIRPGVIPATDTSGLLPREFRVRTTLTLVPDGANGRTRAHSTHSGRLGALVSVDTCYTVLQGREPRARTRRSVSPSPTGPVCHEESGTSTGSWERAEGTGGRETSKTVVGECAYSARA